MQLNKHTSTKHLFWGMLSCIGLIAWFSCSYRNSSKYQQQSYGTTTICSVLAETDATVSATTKHPDREHHLSSRIKYKVKLALKKMVGDTGQYAAPLSNARLINNITGTYNYLERPAYYTFLFRYFLF